MAIENDYSASPFYLWASAAGMWFSPDEDDAVRTVINRTIADLGERVWDYLATGYVQGQAMDPQLALALTDFVDLADPLLEVGDPRRTLVCVWEALVEMHGVAQPNCSFQVVNRSELILRVNALLTEDNLPPELEMYAAIMAMEWSNFEWDHLEQLDFGMAALMQSLHERWQDEVLESFGVQ